WRSYAAGIASQRAVAMLWTVIVVLFVLASLTTPNFLTSPNLINILRQSVLVSLVAIGMTFVVLTGGIDFSIGINAKLSGIVAALAFETVSNSLAVGIAAALAVGVAIGLVNSLLITKIYGNPFIITFGMFSILQGVALALTHDPLYTVP